MVMSHFSASNDAVFWDKVPERATYSIAAPPLRIGVLLGLLALGACSSIGANGCDWARPILVSPADQLTDDTARAILTHDETGAAICHW